MRVRGGEGGKRRRVQPKMEECEHGQNEEEIFCDAIEDNQAAECAAQEVDGSEKGGEEHGVTILSRVSQYLVSLRMVYWFDRG